MTDTTPSLVRNEHERALVLRGNALLVASVLTGVTVPLLALARSARLSPALNHALSFETGPAVGLVTLLACDGLGARALNRRYRHAAAFMHPYIGWVPLALALFVAPRLVRGAQSPTAVLLHTVPMCTLFFVGSLLTGKFYPRPSEIRWTEGLLPSTHPLAIAVLALAVLTDAHALYAGHLHRPWF